MIEDIPTRHLLFDKTGDVFVPVRACLEIRCHFRIDCTPY
jgi:hypothetical protein